MLGYLAKRLTATVPVILMVAVCVFAFVHVLPGDPARLVAGVDASPEDVQAVRESLGLDRPLPEQFVRYVGRVTYGDFGVSLKTRRTVVEEIGERCYAGTGCGTCHDKIDELVAAAERRRVSGCCGAGCGAFCTPDRATEAASAR